ncbi:putative vesicle transport protein, Got1/SFT2 [Rosa chinensis]|uniref:Vesicle transport protein n=1 Tax=Rosa chinensis TaxID=74649 RepID=A0A2P6REV9_ROSCH|nr:vesicle transport protein SFT2B isoform X1 [Rosa chinensis]PRQ44970.1 putative vesicle transport protein, Got1/SFT2 [Rosa chinensis]
MEKISQAFEKVKMNQAFEKVNVNQAFDKMKMLVGMEADNDDDEEAASSSSALQHQDSFMDDFNRNCTLSTKQRFYGFAICLASGLTCTLLSMLVFFHPIKFAITFTLGNLLSLGSTAFLIGPKRQVTMMLDPVRIYATAIYIASIIIALFCALYAHNKILTLLAIILEFGALVWYSLSYIPFARSMVSKIMLACFDTEF